MMLRPVLAAACLVVLSAVAAWSQTPPGPQPATVPEPQPAAETSASDLARDRLCLSCHQVEAKLVGPAFRDVAGKYRGQADAESRLIAKVRSGGGGVWGKSAMPPSDATDAEAATLVRWILSQ